MDRRSVIRNVFLVSAGVALLPSCLQEETASSIKLDHFKITGEEEKTLAALTEYIIPKTTTPGATDAGAMPFALTMVDDCATHEEQQKFVAGFKAFNELTKHRYSGSFAKLTTEQKAELLKALESKEGLPAEAVAFYETMKRLTIQSFTSSKYYLTEVRKYEMAPGRYHGCVPVTASTKRSN